MEKNYNGLTFFFFNLKKPTTRTETLNWISFIVVILGKYTSIWKYILYLKTFWKSLLGLSVHDLFISACDKKYYPILSSKLFLLFVSDWCLAIVTPNQCTWHDRKTILKSKSKVKKIISKAHMTYLLVIVLYTVNFLKSLCLRWFLEL